MDPRERGAVVSPKISRRKARLLIAGGALAPVAVYAGMLIERERRAVHENPTPQAELNPTSIVTETQRRTLAVKLVKDLRWVLGEFVQEGFYPQEYYNRLPESTDYELSWFLTTKKKDNDRGVTWNLTFGEGLIPLEIDVLYEKDGRVSKVWMGAFLNNPRVPAFSFLGDIEASRDDPARLMEAFFKLPPIDWEPVLEVVRTQQTATKAAFTYPNGRTLEVRMNPYESYLAELTMTEPFYTPVRGQ